MSRFSDNANPLKWSAIVFTAVFKFLHFILLWLMIKLANSSGNHHKIRIKCYLGRGVSPRIDEWGEGAKIILEALPCVWAVLFFWMVFGQVLIIQRSKMLETIRSNTSWTLQDIVVIVGSLTQYTSTAILPERF